MRRLRLDPSLAVALLSGVAFLLLGLCLLDPDTLISVDIAVKLVQARSLLDHGFRSMPVWYPASAIDPLREFYPFFPPFVFDVHGRWESVFPVAVAFWNALWIAWGAAGTVVASALSGAATLYVFGRVKSAAPAWLLALTLGWGTCFWFYCVVPWEHSLAILCTTASWVLICRSPSTRALTSSALLLGVGATLRHESLVLVPGMMLTLWLVHARRRAPFAFAVLAVVPLVFVSAIDVLVFGRPPAAHLAHGADLFARLMGSSVEAVRHKPWPFSRRYDLVMHFLVFGRSGVAYSLAMLAALTGLFVGRRSRFAWGGVLAFAVLFGVQLMADLRGFLPQPDFIEGLLRQSPFLIFAFLPLAGGNRMAHSHRSALLIAVVFVLGLLASLSVNGRVSYGPRFLLPILPMLVYAAGESLWSYRRRIGDAVDPVWLAGIALVAGALCLQMAVGLRAYVRFNSRERVAVHEIRSADSHVLVIDSPFTISVVEPFYTTRYVMMATTPAQASRLAHRLSAASVPSFLLVSREPQQQLIFLPYVRTDSRRFGATVVETWSGGAARPTQ